MAKAEASTIIRSLDFLYPKFARKILAALAACHADGYPIEVFESWRSPQRQNILYAQGRSAPGKVVTSARGWESWHQYGLACDVALRIDGKWSWDFDPGKVAHLFIDEGLTWLNPFEQCHFEWTAGLRPDQAKSLMQSAGLPRLWLELD